jgi:hypothetical protein
MAFAAPSPHPTARASKRRAPRRSSGSLASPSDGSAQRPRSAPSSESHRPDAAPGIGFVPRSPLNSVQMPAKANSGPVLIEREPHHVLFPGLRVRLRRILRKAVGRDEAARSRQSHQFPRHRDHSFQSAVIKSLCRSRCAGTLWRHTRPAVGSCGNPQFERYACARNAEFWFAVRVWRRRQ